jgi:hypothetical protein
MSSMDIAYRTQPIKESPMKTTCIALLFLLVFANSAFAYDVIFNTKTFIFHTPLCEYARNCCPIGGPCIGPCIKIDHRLAKHRGGDTCNVCGGRAKNLPNYKNLKKMLQKNNELAEVIDRKKD